MFERAVAVVVRRLSSSGIVWIEETIVAIVEEAEIASFESATAHGWQIVAAATAVPCLRCSVLVLEFGYLATFGNAAEHSASASSLDLSSSSQSICSQNDSFQYRYWMSSIRSRKIRCCRQGSLVVGG